MPTCNPRTPVAEAEAGLGNIARQHHLKTIITSHSDSVVFISL